MTHFVEEAKKATRDFGTQFKDNYLTDVHVDESLSYNFVRGTLDGALIGIVVYGTVAYVKQFTKLRF